MMQASEQPPQPLLGFRTNQEWQELVAQASAMIELSVALVISPDRAVENSPLCCGMR